MRRLVETCRRLISWSWLATRSSGLRQRRFATLAWGGGSWWHLTALGGGVSWRRLETTAHTAVTCGGGSLWRRWTAVFRGSGGRMRRLGLSWSWLATRSSGLRQRRFATLAWGGGSWWHLTALGGGVSWRRLETTAHTAAACGGESLWRRWAAVFRGGGSRSDTLR